MIFRVDSAATVQIHGSLFWADAQAYIIFRTKFCFAMSTWHVSTYTSYVESQCYSIFFMNLIFWFFIQLTQVSVFFAMAKYSKLTLKSLKTANFSCTFSIYLMVLSCHCTLFDPGNELSVIFSEFVQLFFMWVGISMRDRPAVQPRPFSSEALPAASGMVDPPRSSIHPVKNHTHFNGKYP